MARPPRTKYLTKKDARRLGISLSQYPNFGPNGNITGMRKLYYGDAFLVKSGAYVYKVPKRVYDKVPG